MHSRYVSQRWTARESYRWLPGLIRTYGYMDHAQLLRQHGTALVNITLTNDTSTLQDYTEHLTFYGAPSMDGRPAPQTQLFSEEVDQASVSCLPDLRSFYNYAGQQDDIYTRQRMVNLGGHPLSVPQSAIVIGLGGVGFWVAVYAAMSGVMELVLFDDDVIESTNLERLPVGMYTVGEAKVAVAAMFIRSLRPNCSVINIRERAPRYLPPADVVFDCTDGDLATHKAIERAARMHGDMTQYIRAGYDGTHITLLTSNPEWGSDDGWSPYSVIPSWVIPASVVAALAVAMACAVEQLDGAALDLTDLFKAY